VALVDDNDFEFLNKWKWYVLKTKYVCYAARDTRVAEPEYPKTLLMHRVLCEPDPKQEVDHKDLDGLNNQRQNLRCCTSSQNKFHRRLSSVNTSGFKGVCWDKFVGRWFTTIRINGKHTSIGHYDDPIEAAKAYDKIALKTHGEFAMTNQQLGLI
jgi:hypothetical protein